MDVLYGCCCGIDVHKDQLTVCLQNGKRQDIREYGTTTAEIRDLCSWLKSNNCEIVAMESTGSFWKPPYNIMELEGLNPIIVNPQHMKQVPGRKTDVSDAQWICELVRHGLLRPSFIPDRRMREFRELIVLRDSHVSDRTSYVNRIQKILEGGNIKLSKDISDINSGSSRAMLDVVLSGKKFDANIYLELRESGKIAPNLKAKMEELIADLDGYLSEVQIFELKKCFHMVDVLSSNIEEIERKIEQMLTPGEKIAIGKICEIPGMGKISAEAVISVIGTDMSRFPTDGHICSWAGLCPGNNKSNKRQGSGRCRRGNRVLKTTLVRCAHAAVKKKDSFFYAQFHRLIHRGAKRAYVAVAHSMLIAIYHILKDGVPFKDLGANYYDQFNRERKIRGDMNRLERHGATVIRLDDKDPASMQEVLEMVTNYYEAKKLEQELESTQGGTSQGEIPQDGTTQGGTSQGEIPQDGTTQGGTSQGEIPQDGTTQGGTSQGEIPQSEGGPSKRGSSKRVSSEGGASIRGSRKKKAASIQEPPESA